MQKLQDICSFYSDKGTVVLMGDLNAHQNGSTFFKRYDRRSVILRDFLAYNNFVSVNTLRVCTGAAYNNLVSVNTLRVCTGANATFVSYSGEFKSMIDH